MTTDDQLDHAFTLLARKAREISTIHDGMHAAYADEANARLHFYAALLESVTPALPVLATRRTVVGRRAPLHMVPLCAKGRRCFYLGATTAQGPWGLWESDPDREQYAPVDLTAGDPPTLPRELDLCESVETIADALRAVTHGNAPKRRAQATELARRLEALAVLLATA